MKALAHAATASSVPPSTSSQALKPEKVSPNDWRQRFNNAVERAQPALLRLAGIVLPEPRFEFVRLPVRYGWAQKAEFHVGLLCVGEP